MEAYEVLHPNPTGMNNATAPKASQKRGMDFQSVLNRGSVTPTTADSRGSNRSFPISSPHRPLGPASVEPLRTDGIRAYQKQGSTEQVSTGFTSDVAKYKDDQLLSNPGGDHYYLEEKKVVHDPKEQESFWGRVGKDLSDTFGNVKNFFKNTFFGAKVHYRDENNQIQEAQQKGLLGSVVEFFKDFGSALSFGLWRPDGESEPQGFVKRAGFFFSKMQEAFFGDLVQGVSGSAIRMGEDLLFAGWNLVESIPDATIGNFKAGRKLTTALFDNGQVVLDYLTDILPSGEAWVRVHSPNIKDLKLPVLNNIKMPEHQTEDSRWKFVRNTSFRKAIETVGSLLTDILTFKFLGQTKLLGEDDD